VPIEYRKNPTTGAMAPFDTGTGSFVGGAPAAPAVTSLFPPKPAQEVTTVRPIVSAMGTEAIKQKELAAGAVQAAQENLGGVEKTIAEKTAPIAQEKTGFLEQQQADAEARRVAREAQKARHLLGRDEQIKSEADAQVKAGNAKEDLLGDGWGAFLATLLTGIGTAAHLFQGGSGPSPAERVLDKRIGAHKEKLMAQWEALKSTRELKDRDHAAYLEAQNTREDEISKDVQRQLKVYEARVEGIAAKMQPEKQQALTRLATAETAKLAAKEKEQDSQRFDAKQSVTTRTEAPGADVKPPPQASVDETEKVSKLEQVARDRRALAEQIEKAGDGPWKDLQVADLKHQREEGMKLPYIGDAYVGPARAIGSSDLSGRLQRALGQPVGGISVEDKLRYNKDAQALWRGVSKVVTQEAKDLGGAVTAADMEAKRAELGVQGQSAKEMAATLRRQADDFEKRAAQMRAQRTFNQSAQPR